MIDNPTADKLATSLLKVYLQRSNCQNLGEIEYSLAFLLSRIAYLLFKTHGKHTVQAMLVALAKKYDELPDEGTKANS